MVHYIRSFHRNPDRRSGGFFPRARGLENSSSRRHSQLLSLVFAVWFFSSANAWAVLPSLTDRSPLKHTILLIHGATIHGSNLNVGPINLGDYFNGVADFLRTTKTEVKVAQLSTDGSIGERAAVLKNYLETDLKGQMVNVVAHSLGGLDARYCISVLKSMQFSSVTTIGTPHTGTPLADWAVAQIDGKGFWYWLFRLVGYDMGTRRFLPDITTYGMKVFNDKVPDSYDVRYFSYVNKAKFGDGNMSLLLWFPMHWLQGQNHYLAANGDDGMVPFDSQAWGKRIGEGELDHLAQMNHHEMRIMDLKREALSMYVSIYDNLLKEGL